MTSKHSVLCGNENHRGNNKIGRQGIPSTPKAIDSSLSKNQLKVLYASLGEEAVAIHGPVNLWLNPETRVSSWTEKLQHVEQVTAGIRLSEGSALCSGPPPTVWFARFVCLFPSRGKHACSCSCLFRHNKRNRAHMSQGSRYDEAVASGVSRVTAPHVWQEKK